MDFWQRARSLAEEAARRSQEITSGISVPSKLSDVVSEASKRSMEIATEASRRSKEIASEALKRADQIKSQLPPAGAAFSSLVDSNAPSTVAPEVSDADLEMFGVTDDLREFVKGITSNTFRDFPLEDDSEISDVPAVSNVRQDLTEWQEKHAKFVLATVKEIKRLRYELCPRAMKERKFWRIYFILVSSFVDQYEKRYMEEQKLNVLERKDSEENETKAVGTSSGDDGVKTNQKSKNATSEQDLDVFLLGDAGDSDDGPDGVMKISKLEGKESSPQEQAPQLECQTSGKRRRFEHLGSDIVETLDDEDVQQDDQDDEHEWEGIWRDSDYEQDDDVHLADLVGSRKIKWHEVLTQLGRKEKNDYDGNNDDEERK